MANVGGSVQSAILGGRYFSVAADANLGRKLGGFENAVEPNGDGTTRLIKTRVAPGFSGLVLNIDDDNGDQEFLQDLADQNDFFPAALTLASGAIWQGTMQIVDELMFNTESSTATAALEGTGRVTKQ